MAKPRHCLKMLKERSTTLRPLYRSGSKFTGRPPRAPRWRRCPIWSSGSGITAAMWRLRSSYRLAREEYALSPNTRSGRVRGRPGPTRGTDKAVSRWANIGESPPWPGATSITNGRPLPSARWWILVLNPPRDRPNAWSAGSRPRFV